eukprot:scaffold175583_cov21-Tisochrysis_lutea.AAC.1
MAQLKTIPYLEPYPSHANFILAKVGVSQHPGLLVILDNQRQENRGKSWSDSAWQHPSEVGFVASSCMRKTATCYAAFISGAVDGANRYPRVKLSEHGQHFALEADSGLLQRNKPQHCWIADADRNGDVRALGETDPDCFLGPVQPVASAVASL